MIRSMVPGLLVALGFAGLVAFLMHLAEVQSAGPQQPMRQVVIEQVANGYTVDLCWKGTPCPVTNGDRRVAKDPQGASAEVFAYLSGKGLPVNWREP